MGSPLLDETRAILIKCMTLYTAPMRELSLGMTLEHIPLTFSHTPHAQRNLHIRGD